MRTLLPICALFAIVAIAFQAVARAAPEGEPDPAVRLKILDAEVKALRADAAYLRAREAALTRYVVGLEATSRVVLSGVAQARTQGFEAAAVAAPSRVVLLRTLEDAARALSAGLPKPDAAAESLRKEADDARKAADELAKSLEAR